ncbi:MAG: hypothetical protein A2052_04745 [Deltaproteobacteria bacterium GWA2_54_12]|nr:MAG: hypothetical protein A2052_04745 [Deltaproteobacteria bacterium GWA2_54_12]
MAKYSITKKLASGFDEAAGKTRAALEREGFSVLGEFRLDEAVKNGRNEAQLMRYAVLPALYAPLAHKAVTVETDIGLLLPSHVIVYEEDGMPTVSVMDPVIAMSMIENPALAIIARELKERLERVIDSIE